MIQDAFPGHHSVAWYWREFDVREPSRQGRRYLLRFGAADYLVEVRLNGIPIGGHEGGETPFVLDATEAVRIGEANRLAVRVLNPTNDPIDGITLAETPHRNKSIPHRNGGSYNYGGILESVELLVTPPVRFQDIHVRTDMNGSIDVRLALDSRLSADAAGLLQISVATAASGETLLYREIRQPIRPGESRAGFRLQLDHPRLWQLVDPFLYRVTVRLQMEGDNDEITARTGFRDFRVADGFFCLNGKRIFVKSTHTGNHCPVGQVVPEAHLRAARYQDRYAGMGRGHGALPPRDRRIAEDRERDRPKGAVEVLSLC
ncbi:MAG: hypothetical protein IT210_10165 [Armatimonadetes bacterium]|nr:hypothetical protein [Armatimonadota bacterium]